MAGEVDDKEFRRGLARHDIDLDVNDEDDGAGAGDRDFESAPEVMASRRVPYDDKAVFEAAEPLLWYPGAKRVLMSDRGFYPKGYPIGAVVHWTSGWNKATAKRTADAIAEAVMVDGRRSYCYFAISATGSIFQAAPLNRWGQHAGESQYKGMKNISNQFVGIEILNGSKLNSGRKSWFGEVYASDEVRNVEASYTVQITYGLARVGKRKKNVNGDYRIPKSGVYQMYTPAQEDALWQLINWLHSNNPQVFSLDNVVGHDEIAPWRKDDPGGSLSVTMPEYRTQLKAGRRGTISVGPQELTVPETPANHDAKFRELCAYYATVPIEYPHLKDITFAQWAHESGYGTSELATKHLNFGGMKWLKEMKTFGHAVDYRPAHDPDGRMYCGFTHLEKFVQAYWARLDIPWIDYTLKGGGWRTHTATANDYIDFIGPIWAPRGGSNSALNASYENKVRDVLKRLGDGKLLPSMMIVASAIANAPAS